MNKEILEHIDKFRLVKVPRYIEQKIQRCALSHLGLRDMGQLRDRMEGQAYYNKLKRDVLSEFAFENVLGMNGFDWKKREVKGYKRKQYNFDFGSVSLVAFSGQEIPKISTKHLSNFVFIYVNPEFRVYVSGLARKSVISQSLSNVVYLENQSSVIEFKEFEKLEDFGSFEELSSILSCGLNIEDNY